MICEKKGDVERFAEEKSTSLKNLGIVASSMHGLRIMSPP
jgi:hypothetical protein